MSALTTPQLAAVRAAYDFENIIPAAAAALMTGYGFTAATAATITKFQETRPRFEILFKTGSGKGRWDPRFPGIAREMAWDGTLSWVIVTNASEDDKVIQAQYASFLRYLMPNFPGLVNNVSLLLQAVHRPIRDGGTSLTMKSDEGYWRTNITWNLDFSIQDNAFDNFPTPTQ